jgi:hypothetical protein
MPALPVLPFEAVRPVKPTSLIRDADLSLRIAGLPAYAGRRKRETELRRPTCSICAGYNWAGTAQWAFPREQSRGNDFSFKLF